MGDQFELAMGANSRARLQWQADQDLTKAPGVILLDQRTTVCEQAVSG